jgi:hypothetical protein
MMTASVLLACEMLEDELLLALDRSLPVDRRPPLVWVESGLHARPEDLRHALQNLIDRLDAGRVSDTPVALEGVRPGTGSAADRREVVTVPPVERVLLAFGYCGNGLQGLVARHLSLVFPRVDDCVSLFLNCGCTREEIVRDGRSFYLTKGWLCHDNPFDKDFDTWVERFGEERARRLRKAMVRSYEHVRMIDTGAYDLPEWMPRSHAWADKLELEHATVRGSVQLLERLLVGPWNSEIVVVPPGEPIGIRHLFEGCGLGVKQTC